MFDTDKWQEIWETIRKNKLRTFLTAFSVAWGIFILIVLLAAGKGLRNGAEAQFKGDAVNSVWLDGGQTSMPYKGMKPGRTIQLTNEDYELINNKINNIQYSSGVFQGHMSKMMSYGKEHAGFTVRSCRPDHQFLENVTIISGRFVNKNDIDEYRKVCAIGKPVQEALFKNVNPIDKFIDVQGTPFKVVGIFTDPGNGDMNRIYIPVTTAQRIYNGKNYLGTIWLSTAGEGVEVGDNMVKEIRTLLAHKYNFDPKDMNAMGAFNSGAEYIKIMNMLYGIKIFIWFIGICTLIAGIVGVSNIMMIIVKERTREIGIRKALGASPGSIVSLIMQESITITSAAGYIGLIAGVGLIELVNTLGMEGDFFKHPEVDFKTALYAITLLVIAGALAGFIPALRAARVEPIVALRSE